MAATRRYPRTERRGGSWRQVSEKTATARRARATLRRSALRERRPMRGPSKAGGAIAFADGEAVQARAAARAEPPRSRLCWPLLWGTDLGSKSLLQERQRVRAAACRATPRHPPRLLRRRSCRTGLGWSRPASESDWAARPHPRRRARSPDRHRRGSGPSASDRHRLRPRPRLPPVPGSFRPSALVASGTLPRPVHGPAVGSPAWRCGS